MMLSNYDLFDRYDAQSKGTALGTTTGTATTPARTLNWGGYGAELSRCASFFTQVVGTPASLTNLESVTVTVETAAGTWNTNPMTKRREVSDTAPSADSAWSEAASFTVPAADIKAGETVVCVPIPKGIKRFVRVKYTPTKKASAENLTGLDVKLVSGLVFGTDEGKIGEIDLEV